MITSLPLVRAAIGAAIFTGALTFWPAPVTAAESQTTCQTTSPPEYPSKKKGLGLGGLLGAAKRAGVGDFLGAGMLGNSRAAQVAGTVGSTAVAATGSGDTASAATVLAGTGRTAQAVGAAAGAAGELARQNRANCSSAAPAQAKAAPQREWHAVN